MQVLPFLKMHGLGNDYVYLDCFSSTTAAILAQTDIAALARRISDRHFGIGSDGLVLILPITNADAYMRMFNADGSEAQMCGNAIRCVAKYLYESGICHHDDLQIATRAGMRSLHVHVTNGVVEQVTVDMGKPVVVEDTIRLDNKVLQFVAVNMGNPHAVFFRDTMISTEELFLLGERIGTHSHFPEGANVEFVKVVNNKEICMRVWERGTGETFACGTGACAAAAAAILQGYTDRDITIHLKGGDLHIRWESDDSPMFMTGSATEVFRGEYDLYD